ncbi:MAG TPA: NIPSNAP family protein [Pirellulaceae bacterium]|nr:NIPSNAP family protein [Pirellulaceae bacterium]
MTYHSRILFAAAGCLLACTLAYFAGNSTGQEKKVTAPRLYELRTYTTEPGRLDALNARFRNHTLKLFEKHGMRNEMYWVPTDPALSKNTLIYVVSHESEAAAKKSWDAFRADPEWIKARDASEKDGKIVAGLTSVYMTPTDYSPAGK